MRAPSSLYLIASQGPYSRLEFLRRVRQSIEGGVDLVQMREKTLDLEAAEDLAMDLAQVCREMNVPLVVNDNAELAKRIGADGLHVGQDDLSPKEARQIVGTGVILGQSTHTWNQVESAMNDPDVDMLGFGPIYETSTKDAGAPKGCSILSRIGQLKEPKPVWAIGGISLNNMSEVMESGCRRVALSSALMNAQDCLAAAKQMKSMLERL
ncbi:MAG: thiamine-phosphate pyrophosphorylase [Planctomycetota bacterium]|jgi:thiamine-phosphate pyrophosphorylase